MIWDGGRYFYFFSSLKEAESQVVFEYRRKPYATLNLWPETEHSCWLWEELWAALPGRLLFFSLPLGLHCP